MSSKNLNFSQGIQIKDHKSMWPKDLEEDQKLINGTVNLANTLPHAKTIKRPNSPSVSYVVGVSEKIIRNIGEDPTEELLEKIQHNMDAERIAPKQVTEEFHVPVYTVDTTRGGSKFGEIEDEVVLADSTVITKVDRSFSPEFAAMRNQKAGRFEEKDFRREESLNAKNAKKGKLPRQERVKGQKFRKEE